MNAEAVGFDQGEVEENFADFWPEVNVANVEDPNVIGIYGNPPSTGESLITNDIGNSATFGKLNPSLTFISNGMHVDSVEIVPDSLDGVVSFRSGNAPSSSVGVHKQIPDVG
ncbi:hypothetical protein V6N12_070006 [Hibiscus sabdariffa]|uniref:Uncharacterized protein n=1 Tax=Hibiscus sabdariffa TaxID=183260 RepID=A0ABR2FFM3_9ROSI